MQSKITKMLLTCLIMLFVTGCATQGKKDPLESMNRRVFKFNDAADRAVLKPVATAYRTITPTLVQRGFSNFFNNLGTLTTVVNDLLQFKFSEAFTDAGRFVINTTFGLGGFIDVAAMDGIPNHREDFGQTLGYWGVSSGPYLVLPLLGPSTVRESAGGLVDATTTSIIGYTRNTGHVRLSNQLIGANIIVARSQLLDASDILDNASLDPYAFVRDAYLQRRATLIADGVQQEAPVESYDDDDFEDFDEDDDYPL